jgi:hypothetical protein
MSENQITEEQQVPTKEELINFFKEQIEVKKVQLELQELNTNLAVAKAEELKALGFIAQMTTQPGQKSAQPEGQPHTLTQEDLDNNPDLASGGFMVGDDIMIPTQPEEAPVKKLKKK